VLVCLLGAPPTGGIHLESNEVVVSAAKHIDSSHNDRHIRWYSAPPPHARPPCAATRRPGWATPSPKPPRGGGLVASPHIEAGSIAIAAKSRIHSFAFMCVLGPLFFRSSLYQLVLTRSRCLQLPKANHFLAYLALLAGPEALSRPAAAQNSLGRGRPPPLCARPCAAARRPGWATTPSPKAHPTPRPTAHRNLQKVPCRNSFRCDPPDMAVVAQPLEWQFRWTSDKH
jgi:hypothetical protein